MPTTKTKVAQHDRDGHPEGGIGVGGVERTDMEIEQPLDLELLHRAMHVVPTPTPAASGEAFPSPLGRLVRVHPDGAPRIVDAGGEPHDQARRSRNTAPNPTSDRANSREIPRPKGPRSYPPAHDRQRRFAGATLRTSCGVASGPRAFFRRASRSSIRRRSPRDRDSECPLPMPPNDVASPLCRPTRRMSRGWANPVKEPIVLVPIR